MGKLKITGVVSDIVKKKIDDIIDNKKGTVKKLNEKDKEIAQKNIDANKPKTKSQQKNLRPVYLKPIGPKPKPSAKQVQVDKAKQNRKNKIETSTKLAPKELQEKFKKQQENLKKLKEDKTKTIKPKTTVKGKKVYDKPIGAVPKGKKIFDKPIGPSPKPSAKQQQTNKARLNRAKKQNKSRAVPKGIKVYNKSIGPRPKSFFQKYKKPIAGAAVVGATIPAMINVDDSKVKSKTITNKKTVKKQESSKDIKSRDVKTYKTKSLKEKKKTNITAGGNTGFGPKGNIFAKNEKDRKRLMDLYGGTGSAAYKAAVKGTQGNLSKKKLSEGTKDKTIGSKPISVKTALNKKFKEKAKAMNTLLQSTVKKPKRNKTIVEKVFGGGPKEEYNIKKGRASKAAIKGAKASMKKEYPQLIKRVTKKSTGGNLKSLPSKSENPGIHKLPPKVKMNMGFKPMFGGGLVASFYDKAEKGEKYKGNASVARQVRGFGKAKKKN